MVVEESGGEGTNTNLRIIPVLLQGSTISQCNDQDIANSVGYSLNEIHPENLSGGTNVKEIKVVGTTRAYRHSDIAALVTSSPTSADPYGAAYTTEAVSTEAFTEPFEFTDGLKVNGKDVLTMGDDGTPSATIGDGDVTTAKIAPITQLLVVKLSQALRTELGR